MTSLPNETRCSQADIIAWNDRKRYELYNGVPVALASPSSEHQLISGELFRQISNYLVGKRCKIYQAPFDVCLFAESGDDPEDVFDIVQPDISIVCDQSKIDSHGCKGAPDMIIEVLSPSTAKHDKLIKFNMYLQAGVKEYWIADSSVNMVSVYKLENGQYHAYVYGSDEIVPIGIFENCKVDLSLVFSTE